MGSAEKPPDPDLERALEVARQYHIPPDIAEKLWARFNEIRNDIACGLVTEEEGLRSFSEFCARTVAVGTDVTATGGPTQAS